MIDGFVGAAGYWDHFPGDRSNPRIVVAVRVGEVETRAIVDTGAPYNILQTELGAVLDAGEKDRSAVSLIIRGREWTGDVVRHPLILRALEGEDLTIQGSFFVPTAILDSGRECPEEYDGPNFIGYLGALERIRFAVDPGGSRWCFGPV